MIQLKTHEKLEVLAGGSTVKKKYETPFGDKRILFLEELSNRIRNQKDASNYPDLITFSFWCRKGNLFIFQKHYKDIENRFGRGLVFHIAPSNVPLNFGYSFIFGFLSGNANVIRIPTKKYDQVNILISLINSLLDEQKFKCFRESNAFIKYDRSNKINKFLSKHSDARIIWGGNETIIDLRKNELPIRSIDIAFSDRVSFCLIDTSILKELDSKSFHRIIKDFYNDTFLSDQNACSSPHLILWIGHAGQEVINVFWNELFKYTKKKYSLEFSKINNKYNMLCNAAIGMGGQFKFTNYDNFIYRVTLKDIPKNIDAFFGDSGLFFEYHINNLESINHILTDKYQTLTYYGVEKKIILKFLKNLNSNSIDRVVPIGKALDIGLIWDGYDIIRILSRKISII